ncbi:MAG: MBL fold metallo-hydrolase [Verrucomicrobiales bacterium]
MLNFATYTGGIAATNAYLVEAPDGPILIDAPGGCADWIRSRGASVKALLLTHQHFDHCLDAAQIADDHGCKVFSHSQLSISLTLEEFFGALGGSFAVRPFSAVEIGGDERLTAGGLAFELIYLPGHSQDSLCFYHRESGTLFAGDTLMA